MTGESLFDTAEVYGPYTSEEWVGAVAPFRDKVKIETKFGFGVEEGQPTALNSCTERVRHLVEGAGDQDIPYTSGTPYEMEEFDAAYAKIDLMGHRADPFTESQIDK